MHRARLCKSIFRRLIEKMTRKRYKKLLMGKYKFPRNEAEAISRWENRSIEEKDDETIIGGHIHIFKPNHWRVMQREKFVEFLLANFSKLIAEGKHSQLFYYINTLWQI